MVIIPIGCIRVCMMIAWRESKQSGTKSTGNIDYCPRIEMRNGRNCSSTSGWDGNNREGKGTGNSREGNRLWDGINPGREQDTLRRDGRRHVKNKARTGTVGKSRPGTKRHTVSSSRPMTVSTFTADASA